MSVVYPQVLNKEDWRALEYIVNGWRFDPKLRIVLCLKRENNWKYDRSPKMIR